MEKVKLENVCVFIRNGVNIKNNKNKNGIPITRIETISNGIIDENNLGYANIFDEKYEDYYLKQNDILMSHINSIKHLGKVAICNEDKKIIHGMNLLNIRLKKEVFSKYVYYFFKTDNFKKQLHKIAKQSVNQSSFNVGDLKKTNIYLPELQEQKKIANHLDKIQEIIDIRKKQIHELDELIKSQFVEMFEEEINTKKIKDLSSYFSRGKSPNYVEKSGIKVINQACIYWNNFKFENVKYQDEDKINKSLDKLIKYNDVLITSTGTGTLGRCNVFKISNDSSYMADGHVSILRFMTDKINPLYFKYYFMQVKVQEKLYSDCVNGSTNQIELSKDKFRDFDIIVPPIELQNKFAGIVERIDKQKLEIQKSLEEMEMLQESLMNKYFG